MEKMFWPVVKKYNPPVFDQNEATFLVPQNIDPDEHTMGREVFLQYIGRKDQKNKSIDTKKFSDKQISLLLESYNEGTSVKIIGCYRDHISLAADALNLNIKNSGFFHHTRDLKVFNKHRTTFFYANNCNNEKELWISVFPSKEYVDQISELICAIFSDLNEKFDLKYAENVEVVHFPSVENSIGDWTGFSKEVSSFIKFGDVVAIGNTEFFACGIEDAGYYPIHNYWTMFGLNDMFGYKIYIEEKRKSRIVVIGICECFWGSASAQYCEAIYESGARHILYGSKAASLIAKETVHEIISPVSYINITDNPSNEEFRSDVVSSELKDTLSIFGINQGNTSVTVPTVIGEDANQRKRYEYWSPTCMDCENGHIAIVVGKLNDKVKSLGYRNNFYQFIPVHFITDYIHRASENATDTIGNLAVHDDNKLYKVKRDESFRKIGHFFAIYGLKNGVTEVVPGEFTQKKGLGGVVEINSIMKSIRGFLDIGMGREAVTSLSYLYGIEDVPKPILISLAMVAQKFGMSSLLSRVIAALDSETIDYGDDMLRLNIISVKMATQFGQHSAALHELEKLFSVYEKKELSEIDQLCALKRREAISWASCGRRDKFESSMVEAEVEGKVQGQRATYHYACNKLWRFIGENHFSEIRFQGGLREISEELSDMREIYGNLSSTVWWQTNFEKGALAALYLEASYYIQHGNFNERSLGYKKLFMAATLRDKIGGGENSEAFGEVLNSIQNSSLKAIIALSMQDDSSAREEFQSFIQPKCEAFVSNSDDILSLIQSNPVDRESAIQKLIKGI